MDNKLVNQTALTKLDQENLAEVISNNLLEGSVDLLEAYGKLKAMEAVLSKVKAKIEEESITEADKYGKGKHSAHGFEFQVKEGSKRYDYSGDAEYTRLKEALKERENMLKNIPYEMVDPETGEVATPPKIKYTKSSLNILFPKE
jgi:hypothetical protein